MNLFPLERTSESVGKKERQGWYYLGFCSLLYGLKCNTVMEDAKASVKVRDNPFPFAHTHVSTLSHTRTQALSHILAHMHSLTTARTNTVTHKHTSSHYHVGIQIQQYYLCSLYCTSGHSPNFGRLQVSEGLFFLCNPFITTTTTTTSISNLQGEWSQLYLSLQYMSTHVMSTHIYSNTHTHMYILTETTHSLIQFQVKQASVIIQPLVRFCYYSKRLLGDIWGLSGANCSFMKYTVTA